MQKFKYIELGDNKSSQNEDLYSKRTDEMNDYLERNDIVHNSKLIFSDLNRQIYKVDESEVAESDNKTLLYVRYLEQIPQIEQIISQRSIKLSGISQKYLAKFIKYDIIQDNNLPLVVQHIESSRIKEPFTDVYKNSIPIDQILRILKRLIKIVTNLHQSGINFLDISESNFEIDIQSYKPTMIAVPLCIRGDISQSEACYRDFEELGLMMLKLVNNSNILYANDLSFEQMRLKTCVVQVCQEFTDCRHIANGIQSFVVKQMNRLTCIKQICKSISQGVDEINVQQFMPNRKTHAEFHRQIETLEIDILGSIPEAYRTNQQYGPKTCKERWLNKILCLLISSFFLISILFIWSSRSSPFECVRNNDDMNCKVKVEKEGFLFSTMRIEWAIRSLTIDFSGHQLNAEKIIEMLSKIERPQINNFKIEAQYNNINQEGLKQLLQYIKDDGKAFYIQLNIFNTPVDDDYLEKYSVDVQTAYDSVNSIFESYKFVINSTHSFTLQSELSSYLNALLFLSQAEHQSEKNYIYLLDQKLKDNEAVLIFDDVFNKMHHFSSIHINLGHNQIDGSCLVRVMEKYVNKFNNYTQLNLKFNSNPIKKENYQKLLNLLQENTSLKSVSLELDLSPFMDQIEFSDITFFQKNNSSLITSFYVNLVDLKVKDLYLISKQLTENRISFDIELKVSELNELDQFLNDFPTGENFCFPILSQSVTNSIVDLHLVEIKVSLDRIPKKEISLCDTQNDKKGLQINTLKVFSDEIFVEKSISIVDPQDKHNFRIQSIFQSSSQQIIDNNSLSVIQSQMLSTFRQMIVVSTFISDSGVKNILQTGLNNEKLQELQLSAEFSAIPSNTISYLLELLVKHPSLEIAYLTLHESDNLYRKNDYPILNSYQQVQEIVAETVKQTEHLKELFISDSKSGLSDLNSVISAFEISPSLKNLTVHFNIQNFTQSDIRTFYYIKRKLQDKEKYLKLSPYLLFQDRRIYQLESFYERILFHLRDLGSRVFLSSSSEDPISKQMIDDFVNEIDNAKSKEIFIQIQTEFSSLDYSAISKKISKNPHIEEFIFRVSDQVKLDKEEIQSVLDNFSQNTSIESLGLKLHSNLINFPSYQQDIQQSIQKLINGMSNLQKIDLECSQCFISDKALYEVMTYAFLSSSLKQGRIEDNSIKLNEFYQKRLAFMSAASGKLQLYPFSQNEQQHNKFYLECVSQFASYNKEDLSLTYVNSQFDDGLIKFINLFIQRKGAYLQSIILKLSGNSVSDKGIEILTKEIQKLNKLQLVDFDFENNQIENIGCSNIISSLIPSQQSLKSISLNFKKNKLERQECYELLINLLQSLTNLEEVSLILPETNYEFFMQLVNLLSEKTYIKKIYIDIEGLYLNLEYYKQIGQIMGKIKTTKKVIIKGQYERVVDAYFNLEKTKLEQYGFFKLDFSNTFQYSDSIEDIFNQLAETNIKPYNINLNLKSNKLEDYTIYPLVDYLSKESEKITELDFNFSDNPLSAGSCQILTEQLAQITSLYKFTIDFRDTDMGYKCIESIYQMKQKLQYINQIVIKVNDLTPEEQEDAKKLFGKCECVGFVFN